MTPHLNILRTTASLVCFLSLFLLANAVSAYTIVTFEYNDGETDSTRQLFSGTYEELPTPPRKFAHTFAGWVYLEKPPEDGVITNTAYKTKGALLQTTENHTLYASWKGDWDNLTYGLSFTSSTGTIHSAYGNYPNGGINIPDTYHPNSVLIGSPVKAITSNGSSGMFVAFSQTVADLSRATNLISISKKIHGSSSTTAYITLKGKMAGPENILDDGFKYTKVIDSFYLPNNVKKIGRQAFQDVVKTEYGAPNQRLVLPEGLLELGTKSSGAVFGGCTAFTGAVEIPASLTLMGSAIFSGTNINTIYLSKNTSIYNGNSPTSGVTRL